MAGMLQGFADYSPAVRDGRRLIVNGAPQAARRRLLGGEADRVVFCGSNGFWKAFERDLVSYARPSAAAQPMPDSDPVIAPGFSVDPPAQGSPGGLQTDPRQRREFISAEPLLHGRGRHLASLRRHSLIPSKRAYYQAISIADNRAYDG
jgi:hypothetical protein